ncbi:MAG TPA: MlaD family protein [Steroidobacteraceae bacterium]|nr:MlaD family protein [Steroidobacteraceae bacterium]
MERDAKYVAVGAFALVAIAMAAVFLLWYSESRDRRDYQPYEIYFSGTVSGLTRGGPVRYLGVDVGRVRHLSIDAEDPGRVKVVADIDTTAPINSATRASLGLQGVTGLLYVDLKQVDQAQPGEPLPIGDRYPVIPSQASDFDVFVSSLPELVGRATTLIGRFNDLVSEENVAAFSSTLANLEETTETLPQTATQVAALVADVQKTLEEIEVTATQLRETVGDARPQVGSLLERFNEVAANLASLSERLDRLVADSETRVGQFANQGLFALEDLLRESRAAANELSELSRTLRENPSRLLYRPPESGVEIEP